MSRTYYLTHKSGPNGGPEPIVVVPEGELNGTRRGAFMVTRGDRTLRCEITWTEGRLRLLVDGKVHACQIDRVDGGYRVHLAGHTIDVGLLTDRELRRQQRSGGAHGDDSPVVRSPMAGRVVAVRVEPGQSVEAGQGLLIVEAMKMENEIRAARAGVIAAVLVAAGDTVDLDQELLRYEQPASA